MWKVKRRVLYVSWTCGLMEVMGMGCDGKLEGRLLVSVSAC